MAAAGATMATTTRPHPYRGPVAFSLGMHGLLVLLLSLNLSFCEREVVLPPVPAHVKAVVLERSVAPPVSAPAPQPLPEPEPPKPEPKKPEPKKPEPRKPEPKKPDAKKPLPKPAPPKPEAKKPEPKPVEKPVAREKPPAPDFSALLEEEENALAARDAAKKAAAQQAQRDASARALQDARVVNEYKLLISNELKKRWNRPPSARNGMQAELRITLIPGGEVLDVKLVKSSGDPAFDRSAENAIRLAGRLPVPSDPAVFNAYFRQFKFLFQPEDLKQ